MGIDFSLQQYTELKKVLEGCGIATENAEVNFGEEMMQLESICNYLSDDISELQSAAASLSYAVYEMDREGIITAVEKMAKYIGEMEEDYVVLGSASKGVITSVSRLAKPSLTFFYTDSEIKAKIDQHLQPDHTLSVGYNGGRFALIFATVDEEEVETPYLIDVIAMGKEDDYDEVAEYIESFIDLTDEPLESERYKYNHRRTCGCICVYRCTM